jgi:hypothetical protein
MGLAVEWTGEDGNFADNTDGAITAQTLRNFAEAISIDSPDEWIEIVPGPLDFPDHGDWDLADTQVLIWLPALVSGEGGGSGRTTDLWSYSAGDYDMDSIIFEIAVASYSGELDVLATVELSNTNFTISGVTPNTTVTPVMAYGSALSITTALGSYPFDTDLLTLFGPSAQIASDETPLSVAARHSLPILSNAPLASSVIVGLLFSPPSGAPVADPEAPAPVEINPSSPSPFTVLISSRPTQAWVPITA